MRAKQSKPGLQAQVKFFSKYFHIRFIWSKMTVDELEQSYVLVPAKVKDSYLFYYLKEYLDKNSKSSVIVFTSTCRLVEIV